MTEWTGGCESAEGLKTTEHLNVQSGEPNVRSLSCSVYATSRPRLTNITQ